jgi:hypothetical protein
MSTFLTNNNVTFNVTGGSVVIDPSKGTVTLSNTSGASSSVNLSNISNSSFSLSAGAISMSLSANGNGTYSFKDGLVSGSLGYTVGTGLTSAAISFGANAGGIQAGLSVSLSQTNGQWTGTATAGVTAQTSFSMGSFGNFNIPGATWVNNNLSKTVTFSPSTTDPCNLMGNGLLARTCSTLENGSQTGSINVNEQKALQEESLSNETFTPYSDGAGGSLLLGNNGTVVSMDSTGAGVIYSSTTNGQGLLYSDYNSTGLITDADIAGQGGSLNFSNASASVAAGGQVTFSGSGLNITGNSGASITVGGNTASGTTDQVYLTNGGTVTLTSNSRADIYNQNSSAVCTINANGNDNLGARGGDITVNGLGAGVNVWGGDNGTNAPIVDAFNLIGGIATIDANSRVNVNNTSSTAACTVNGGGNSNDGAYGANMSVNALNGDNVWVSTGTKITYAANATGNVIASGSGNTVVDAQGDDIGVNGPGETIDYVPGSRVFITGTGSSHDTLVGSGDISGTAADGQKAGVVADNSSTYTMNGGNNAFTNGTNVNFTVANTNGLPDIGTGSQDTLILNYNTQINDTGNNDSLTGNGSDTYVLTGTYDPVNDANETGSSTVTWRSNTGSFTGDIDNNAGDSTSDVTFGAAINGANLNTSEAIILNLNGGKVQSTNLTNSNTYFDIENSGDRVHTAWGTAGEGMLVLDPQGKHEVTEGASLVKGFTALQLQDSNGDSKIDSQDPIWQQLRVWVDKTGSGKFEPGTLYSLDQLGVTSIDLRPTNVNQSVNGNQMLYDGMFTKKDGTTGDLASVDLAYDRNDIAKNNKMLASSTVASGDTISTVLNRLVQSMASFTDGHTGIDSIHHLTASNDDMPQLAAAYKENRVYA